VLPWRAWTVALIAALALACVPAVQRSELAGGQGHDVLAAAVSVAQVAPSQRGAVDAPPPALPGPGAEPRGPSAEAAPRADPVPVRLVFQRPRGWHGSRAPPLPTPSI